nr:MAG TPA: hypothetical protein [Caudoviricetes sp.]
MQSINRLCRLFYEGTNGFVHLVFCFVCFSWRILL